MTTDLRTRMQAATTFLCADCGRRHSIATGHPITPPKQRSSEAVPAEDGLRELRALSEAATPGPWLTWHGDDSYCMNCYGITTGPCDHEYVDDEGHAQHTVALTLLQQPRYASLPDDWDANAALIVAAVNYVRAALASTERAAGECSIEPAFSQHEYAVAYCETHDQPADQCTADSTPSSSTPVSPRTPPMSGSPRTAADPMWADPTQPRTKAGQRLIASFPANCADCERPEFIRHVAQSILAIEQEAHDANRAPMTTWRGLCGHVWECHNCGLEPYRHECPITAEAILAIEAEATTPGESRTLVEAQDEAAFRGEPCPTCGSPWRAEAWYQYDLRKKAEAALAEVPVIPDELTRERLADAILVAAYENDRRPPGDGFEWYGSANDMADGILAALSEPPQ